MAQNKVISLNEPASDAPHLHATAHPQVVDQQDDEIDLLALMGTLWRGKWLILLAMIVAVFIGGYYAYRFAIPVYTTTASVALDPKKQNVTGMSSVISGLSGDQATVNTEVEVIRSRGLMEKLVKALDLTNDPEFNDRLRPQSPYAVKPFIKRLLGMNTKKPIPTDRAILDATIDNVLKAMSVSNKRQSYVFNITATTTSPEKSAKMANTLAKLYILDQLDVKFKATQQATKWLTERVADLKQKLENAVKKVKDFNSQAELISPKGLVALQRQLKETRDRIKNASADLRQQAAHLNALKAAASEGNPDKMVELAGDRNLARIRTMLKAGNVKRATFDAAFTTFLNRAEQDFQRASFQNETLKASLARLKGRIKRQSSDLVTLQQLQREAAASQAIYAYFLKRLKETSVQQGIQKADSRVLSRAVVPIYASAPRKSLILVLSTLLGLFAGAGVVLGREMLQYGFRTAEDLELATGYTVIGQIPKMPVGKRLDTLRYLTEKPTSAAAESVRNLRTSVLLSDVDHPPRIIMITSSTPGEGKTTASLAFSQNLAGLGKKVLLIEGDIRRRTFTQYFKLEGVKGILSVISGDVDLSEAVYRDPKLGFDILVGEKSSTNAADVFSSDKFRAFLKAASADYDYVVIDTPPVLIVPDARVIAQSVDAVLYSVKWDATSKAQVLQGLKMFETVNRPVTGLILSLIDPKGMKRYGGAKYGSYDAKGYYDN